MGVRKNNGQTSLILIEHSHRKTRHVSTLDPVKQPRTVRLIIPFFGMETRSKTEHIVKPRDEVEPQYDSLPPGNKWGEPELNSLSVTFQHQINTEIRNLTKFIKLRSGYVVPAEVQQCITPVRMVNDISD
jgi:hypothetical protein